MSTVPAPGSTVLVVGGGVVGTSTAYALASAGYAVTLVTAERIGDGATAGNAGLLVPADSVVWPGPANARAVPATLLGRGGSSIKVSWTNPGTVVWGARFLANSTARKYAAACRATHALSTHSLKVARDWAASGELGTDLKRTGMLFLLDSPAAVAEALHARASLRDAGETYVELSRAELVAMDPAYDALPDGLHALYAAGAARGDSRAFTRALAGRLRDVGASVIEGRPVRRLLYGRGRVTGVATAAGELHAVAVVLAAGVGSRSLARTAGVRVPILPVKGYAATVPVHEPGLAPDVGGVVEGLHVAYSRMGERLRLSTGAEIGCTDHDVAGQAARLLRRAGEWLFPGALDWSSATYRAEHRPMTPTGLPLIGPTGVPGLYLNAAHGSLGWTQAAGSADLLAHLLMGLPPPIDPTPFLPAA
ncbi:FAD-dependent oxidoreductase [Actinomadura logoneensis]|uniref:FAD-dependent oxidoreductase n=1 Tax=Actinomadura logoneensis TaxID=2293572 RepID=A0A372JIH6_9ACTN|nr:FAD-dependent oxidoreductase [Actinomadura logoneensis]RFU39817.1 FAD-dependent oxidoreductase [Actinomadura logoneensis]